MANNSEKKELEGTRKLMAALGRMQPKPHAEMKVGTGTTPKKKKSKKKKQ